LLVSFSHGKKIMANRTVLFSALNTIQNNPIGAASFNNECGRPSIAGYFCTFEEDGPGGQRRGYHKPIMIAGRLENILGSHIHKTKFLPGTAIIVLGGPSNVNWSRWCSFQHVCW
jgi:phosphoribosylformylglycinamidine synthase